MLQITGILKAAVDARRENGIYLLARRHDSRLEQPDDVQEKAVFVRDNGPEANWKKIIGFASLKLGSRVRLKAST